MVHSNRCKLLPSDIDNALKVFGIEVSIISKMNIYFYDQYNKYQILCYFIENC
jgi:hypothetical protein